jgi:ABC-type antimicrobial peptide transport system permease subunit
VHNNALDQAPEPTMYWPLRQSRDAPTMSLVARTSGDPEALLGMARAALATVDASQPIFDLQPLDALLARSLAQRRFTLLLMSLFGLVALVLAAVGIYAVIAYGVTQRTQEIGIRVALGARPASVFALVLRDGLRLVGLGLALGTAAALALTRLASSLLFGILATDAVTYLAIAGTLTAVAVVAMLLPARRAMRVDPIQALKAE